MRKITGLLALCAAFFSAALQAHPVAHRPGLRAPSVWPSVDAIAAARQPDSDDLSITQHAVTAGAERLRYTATAGHFPLANDAGEPQVNIFFVSYVKQDTAADPTRPITFAFNGGPGASSMWLHLGVGPKRVALTVDGTALPGQAALSDNEATWLTFTDLVFVDPAGTGYSRAAEGIDPNQFYEVSRDVETMGRFVRDYLTRYHRAQSPKFILGESYGTTRAAALIDWLQESAEISVNGALLISSVLDFQTISFRPHNSLAYVLALPTYAATAWYHEKLPGSLTDVVQEAEQWARSEYLVALAKGAAVTDAERARVAKRLERYTRLDNEALHRHLRVGPRTFATELLQSTSRVVGRFDSRVTASAASDAARKTETDPSFSGLTRQLRKALMDYMRSDLQYRTDLRYVALSHEANRSWQWPAGGQGYLYVADELAEAMSRDRGLRVFAAAGYYDLATPYAAQKYTFEQMELEPELRRNLTFIGYPAGHQIYTDPAAAEKLKTDVQKFVQCAVGKRCD